MFVVLAALTVYGDGFQPYRQVRAVIRECGQRLSVEWR